MENAKKPAVFFQISLKSLSKYLVAQNGAFERQIAATLTFGRSYFPNTELKPLNHLKLVLAFLATSTCPTNVACPAWKLPKNLQFSFKLFGRDNSYNCRILFPQHWILKSLLDYLDFVMASLVASSEAQLPLHVLHGKCQETCSFLSNFSQIPFKILGLSKWSIWKANCSNSYTSQTFHLPNVEFKFIEFLGFPCNIHWLN